MSTRIADDFAFIRARMAEIEAPQAPSSHLRWWCEACQVELDDAEVAEGYHSKCGNTVREACAECFNGGWVQVYSPRPPAFGVCPACGNPSGAPSP